MIQPSIYNRTPKGRRVSDQTKFKLLEWAEWATKLILVGVFALVWQNSADMHAIKTQMASERGAQQAFNTDIKAKITAIESSYMTRMEVLETVKRVEQNQEIIILRFKLDKQKEGKL
jgi:hypothetical protein